MTPVKQISSPQQGSDVYNAQFVAGFKAGQSANGGLGLEVEQSPTLSATPSALEPTVVIAKEDKVLAAGFSFGQSAKASGIGWQEECSPTIRGGEGGNQKPHILIHERE